MVGFKTSIELLIAEEEDCNKWNAIVESSQHGTIFHTWKWLRIMEKHTKSKFYPIMGMNGNIILGIYPLFYRRNLFINSVFSPPPWTAVPYLGPIIVDYDKLKQDKKESIFIGFQKKVDEFIRFELKSNYTLVSLSPGLQDARPFIWNGYHVEPIYHYIIDLSNGEDHVWMQFKKSVREHIKKSIRDEICIVEGSKEEMIWIINALVRRYDDQDKKTTLSIEYLLEIYNSFYPQNIRIFIARYNNEIISGMVDIYYKDTVISWIGNMKADVVGSVSPNELLQWEGLKCAIKNGIKHYVEMGANTERLCSYKSKYNPDLSICFSAKKYSLVSKLAETAYSKVLKPMNGLISQRS